MTSVMSKLKRPISLEHVGEFHSTDEFRNLFLKCRLRIITFMLRPMFFPIRHTIYRMLLKLGIARANPVLIEFKLKRPLDYLLALPRFGYYSIDILASV